MSLTGLTTPQLLQATIDFIGSALVVAGFNVNIDRDQIPWHAEPDQLNCGDCVAASGAWYTIVGWIVRRYESDGLLNEVLSGEQGVFDATQMAFTVARCWPPLDSAPTSTDGRSAVALELAAVVDALGATFAGCTNAPLTYNPACRKFRHSGFTAKRQRTATPYAGENEIVYWCAGWEFSLTVG